MMIGKSTWVGVGLGLVVAVLSLALFSWRAPLTLAADNIDDVDGLKTVNLEFGGTQNSLILDLVEETTTDKNQIVFILTEITPKMVRNNFVIFTFEYQANLVDLPAYGLKNGHSSANQCELESTIEIDIKIDEDQWDRVTQAGEYNLSWRFYNLDGQNLEAKLRLPILNQTSQATTDDCFILEQTIRFRTPNMTPIFSLIGSQNLEASCSGLEIYGRGGDDLEQFNRNYLCYDDFSISNDEEKDPISEIENSPFDEAYIFVEFRPDSDKCGGRILVDRQAVDEAQNPLRAQWQDWHDDCQKGQYDADKPQKKVVNIGLTNATLEVVEQNPDTTINRGDTGGGVLSGSAQVNQEQCHDKAWFFCDIIVLLSEGLFWVEDQIYLQLAVERSDYRQELQPDSPVRAFAYQDAWRNMRNFMTFTIIGTALFMVISTALDIGMFKNYTVKKYLPRLVVGTILIQFSWGLGDIFIQVTNQLGDVLSSLLFASFPGAEDHGLDTILSGGVGENVAAGVGIFSLISLGLATLLPVVVTLFATLFFGFLFIVIRKYLIIFLLILAPLGIALWILPGNDKAWKTYIKTFFYLLLVYPIIVAVISGAKIFSYLILL